MENITAEEADVVPRHHRIIISVILMAITVTGIFGNTLTFIAYCLSRRLQTKTNMFVINLAAADILTCVCLPINTLALLLDVNVNTRSWLNTLCAVDYGGLGIFLTSSFMTLAFIAVNRYVLITKSTEAYRRIYRRKFTLIFISACWLFPTLTLTPQLVLGILYIGYDETLHACSEGSNPRWQHLSDMILMIVFGLPTVAIIYSYGRIYLFLRRHNKQMQEGMLSEPSRFVLLYFLGRHRPKGDGRKVKASPVSQNQVDITKNLFYILVAFFICLIPFIISDVLGANDIVFTYTKTLILFNSCINPILYGIKHPHFREVFYNILSRRWSEIPEPAFRWMNSRPSRSAVAGSKSKDLDAISMEVLEKSDA
ncbi:G-protein coupled receptor moody [Holothuria leucospilota]|uniref:G-protein coupled receptor moody n=1 Tax=Holothuria leucospilota TaxID=206669 RepID=A0A9Q0YN73_HOLLE|nr:G-protein coupled receptor moody [Holothuria leucospilota]